MSLAGLRVGYLLASPQIVREVDKARLPYNVNFFSQMAALAALEDASALEANVARLVRLREGLLAELQLLRGVRAYPSRANFILFALEGRPPRPAARAWSARRARRTSISRSTSTARVAPPSPRASASSITC